MVQRCSTCRHENPDAAKYCLECGAGLSRACPSCGRPLVPGAKFCMECGTSIGDPTTAPAPTGGTTGGRLVSERRTTTVLFGDLVSFTTLSESRDPEEVRELLSEYFTVARTVVGRYGGTIEKFIGDAVMAVWGVPVSHEDDAERAVRAGLDLLAEVVALGAKVGAPDLSMRVGITTGSVAVTLGAVNEGMVAGDAVNTAARVQTAAMPGSVFVDQETRGLTAAAISFSDTGEHTLKGKAEPARLFRADAVVAAVGGAQRVDGLEAPMVGRDAPLRQVKELFHATQSDGQSRIVLVTGMPGVGKSRLGWEFEKYIDGLSDSVRWHRGRCLSYGEGVAFWAFAEMIRSRLGLLETDDRTVVQHRLHDFLDGLTDAGEAAWLAPRLGVLLGGGERAAFDRIDLFTAWTTFLDRVGGEDPVVLLFEDTHHADAGLLDLAEHLLVAGRAKLFVLALARPELIEQRPSLAAGRRASVIELAPLAKEVMGSLVDGLVADLPARARAAIVARAEGVPLYAVETVRSLIDHDAVVAREGRYVFVDHDQQRVDLDQLAAPTSLQTLIAARLDALAPVERRVVQDAAVMGQTFRHETLLEVADLSGYEVDTALAGLVRKGVLATNDDPRSSDRGQYRFLQALVREVAYGTLSRKDRRARHLAMADHLEQQDDGTDELAGLVAQHLLNALGSSGEQESDRAELTRRALGRLAAAAERSMRLGSPAEALGSLEQVLALAPPPEVERPTLVAAARAAVSAGRLSTGEDLAHRARVAYTAVADQDAADAAAAIQVQALSRDGKAKEAIAVAAELERRAGAGVRAEVRLEMLAPLLSARRALGQRVEMREIAFEHVALAERTGSNDALVAGLVSMGLSLAEEGATVAQVALLNAGADLARQQHLMEPLGRALSNLLSEQYLVDLPGALDRATEALSVNRRVGVAHWVTNTLTNCGFTWWMAGRWDQLEDELARWAEEQESNPAFAALWVVLGLQRRARGLPLDLGVVADSDDPWEQHCAELVRGLVQAENGDVVGASQRIADSAVRLWGDGLSEDIEVLLAPVVELQLAAGRVDVAEELMALFAPRLSGRVRPVSQAEVHRLRGLIAVARGLDPEIDLRAAEQAHAAYGAPYQLAQTRHELARWLSTQERGTEAAVLAARARETYELLGARPALTELDALLEQLSGLRV